MNVETQISTTIEVTFLNDNDELDYYERIAQTHSKPSPLRRRGERGRNGMRGRGGIGGRRGRGK